MNRTITVIYQEGVLKPNIPLNIPENTNLLIQIVDQSENQSDEAKKAYQALLDDGLIQPIKLQKGKTVTSAERKKAAIAYGKIGPLSELIIAERDDR